MENDILAPGEATRILEARMAELSCDCGSGLAITHGCVCELCSNMCEQPDIDLPSGEVRIVNEKTGGQKGSKNIQMSYLPHDELKDVLRLYHEGAKKYAKDNWKLGFDWSLSYDALQRHAMDFWNGESEHEVIDGDPDTRCKHLASVVFHALALMYFENNHTELDDRPSSKARPI